MDYNVYSFLGLAKKANKLVSGDSNCEKAIRSNKAHLVIVSQDAAENTKKKFSDACLYRNLKFRYFGDKNELGKWIGKDIRSVIVILDEKLSNHIMELIDAINMKVGVMDSAEN